MKIAIDGPAASGKGTLTKLLAEKIGAKYLNTGKLYRVVAFSIDTNFDITAQAIQHSADFERYLDIFNDNNEIYSRKNSDLTSKISIIPQVRENLLDFQRSFSEMHNPVILEGRDIGTQIIPNADYKFFITATPEERAKRRYDQLNEGDKTDYNLILSEIKARDAQDSSRKDSPMKPAEDAIIIDTTDLGIEESLAEILRYIK